MKITLSTLASFLFLNSKEGTEIPAENYETAVWAMARQSFLACLWELLNFFPISSFLKWPLRWNVDINIRTADMSVLRVRQTYEEATRTIIMTNKAKCTAFFFFFRNKETNLLIFLPIRVYAVSIGFSTLPINIDGIEISTNQVMLIV